MLPSYKLSLVSTITPRGGLRMKKRTNIDVTGVRTLKLSPVNTGCLTVFLQHFHNIVILQVGLFLAGLASCVVLPALDGRLDAFIVEIGVVLLLELGENLLQLFDPVLQIVALVQHIVQGATELSNAGFS